jgi:phosphonate transport system substrate-binding protein
MVEPYGQNNMSKTIWLGAVAYNPKVVTIWEGMRQYFHEEAHLPVEVVLFQSYEAQVIALLARPGEALPCIDIAWNTNLAYLQADEWSGHACRAIAMRDTDLDWMTKIVAVTGGPIAAITDLKNPDLKNSDLKNRTLALGSRDSGHAAILPVHFLEQQGMIEGRDYRTLRFDTDLGKHGDTGTSEVEVVRAVLDGRADAGAIGNRFWNTVQNERLVPEGGLREIWSSPAYNHCMFTARPELDFEQQQRFVDALSAMSYENPVHRPILEAEGLKRWLAPHLDGYAALRQAANEQGFFKQVLANSALSHV